MGHVLIALGGAFLAAGLMARFGRRFGLPTIPLFMAAGIIFGPQTPGFVLVEAPSDLTVLAALVVAGVVGISSSAIATKLLIELHRLTNPETRMILGIVVVEDVFLALYLA